MAKDKRQTEHETRALPDRRPQHNGPGPGNPYLPEYYGQQREYVVKSAPIKAGPQEQLQDVRIIMSIKICS